MDQKRPKHEGMKHFWGHTIFGLGKMKISFHAGKIEKHQEHQIDRLKK